MALAAGDEELRLATASTDDLAFVRRGNRFCIQYVAAAFARYGKKACYGVRESEIEIDGDGREVVRYRPRFRTITYEEVWRRVERVATTWSRENIVRPGAFVGLCGFTGADLIVAELACLYLAGVSVPLQPSLPQEDLLHIAEQTELSVLVSSAEHLPATSSALAACRSLCHVIVFGMESLTHEQRTKTLRSMEEWRKAGLHVATLDEVEKRSEDQPILGYAIPGTDTPDENPLVTVSYTSGSTGRPKGVMYPESRWAQRLSGALREVPMPLVTVGYLPLCHMAGRLPIYRFLMQGGMTFFVPQRDMSTLFEDIRVVRPTTLMLIPRVSGMIHQHFQTQLVRRGGDYASAIADEALKEAIMSEMRESFLGDRLLHIDAGAAPTAPEVVAFLEQCFGLTVANGYGATELGLVAVNGRIQPGVSYKLDDVPELGYRKSDKPYPRGELLVKSPYKAPGYFKNTAATEALREVDGYVRSGDIVEERAPNHVVWIDRKLSLIHI